MLQDALFNELNNGYSRIIAEYFTTRSAIGNQNKSIYWNNEATSDNINSIDNKLPSIIFDMYLKNYCQDKISEIDNMDFQDIISIGDFKYHNKTYILNNSISLEKIYDSEIELSYYFYMPLNIVLSINEDIGKVKEEFYEQFTALYQFYTKQKDKKLTAGAIKFKNHLIELVKEVKRGKF